MRKPAALPETDFYALLESSPDASATELEGRIRSRLVQARRLVSHPEQGAKATALIGQLRSARQVLLDPERRSRYDEARIQQRSRSDGAWHWRQWAGTQLRTGWQAGARRLQREFERLGLTVERLTRR